jgi:hypothetical protein
VAEQPEEEKEDDKPEKEKEVKPQKVDVLDVHWESLLVEKREEKDATPADLASGGLVGNWGWAMVVNLEKHVMGNNRHNDSGHRLPMPHLSRRVDMRGGWGIGPNGRDAISSHIEVYSAHPSVGQH